jgi:hypothetical protein
MKKSWILRVRFWVKMELTNENKNLTPKTKQNENFNFFF